VFSKMVVKGTFPDTLDQLIAEKEKINKADEN
jgi:hypothetical protein